MLKGPTLEIVMGAKGLDDESIAKLHPGMEKLFENINRVTQVQAIPEVVKSDYCFEGNSSHTISKIFEKKDR